MCGWTTDRMVAQYILSFLGSQTTHESAGLSHACYSVGSFKAWASRRVWSRDGESEYRSNCTIRIGTRSECEICPVATLQQGNGFWWMVVGCLKIERLRSRPIVIPLSPIAWMSAGGVVFSLFCSLALGWHWWHLGLYRCAE